jgi:hypothetical protein
MTVQTFPRLYNRIQSSHRTISLNIYTVRIKMLLIPGGFDHDRKLYVPLSKIVFLTFFFFSFEIFGGPKMSWESYNC